MPRTTSFYEGFTAFETGIPYTQNPHPYSSKKFNDWNIGYRAAHDEFIYDDWGDNLGTENETFFELVFKPFSE